MGAGEVKNIIMANLSLSLLSFFVISLSSVWGNESGLPVLKKLANIIESIESKKSGVQGGAIAILYKGEVLYKTTFGYQKDQAGPIAETTLFPLASSSKPLAAVAIALLIEKEKINLNEKIKFPFLKHEVSLKDILSHTTGFRFTGNAEVEQGLSRQKLLEKLKTQKSYCKPGNCYFYSNTVFSVVEEALRTRGLTFKDAIKNLQIVLKTQEIQIVPLKTSNDIAYPHVKDRTKADFIAKSLPFPPYYPKIVPAAAGVFASLNGMIELYKLSFGYRPDLISQKMIDLMHAPIISTNDPQRWHTILPYKEDKIESYYGLGWRIFRSKDHPGKDLIFHAGCIRGIVSFIGSIPSEEIGIIVLINQDKSSAFKTGLDFWAAVLD